MYLGDTCILHVMDTYTRYSAAAVAETLKKKDCIHYFESVWISSFWPPMHIYCDNAFAKATFCAFAKGIDLELKLIPPRKHSKKVARSKQCVICSIFMHPIEDIADSACCLVARLVALITNNLCRANLLSAIQIARGFLGPCTLLNELHDAVVPDALLEAQTELAAKRMLARMLQSKTAADPSVAVSNTVEIFLRQSHKKAVSGHRHGWLRKCQLRHGQYWSLERRVTQRMFRLRTYAQRYSLNRLLSLFAKRMVIRTLTLWKCWTMPA